MKKLLKEFKAFAFGGNLIDLAIGFIIGLAFATVVESLAKNVIGDLIAALGGQPDLSQTVIHVRHGDVHIGTFLGDLLSFVIVAFVIFLVVRQLNKLKPPPAPAPARARTSSAVATCAEYHAAVALAWQTSLPTPGVAA